MLGKIEEIIKNEQYHWVHKTQDENKLKKNHNTEN